MCVHEKVSRGGAFTQDEVRVAYLAGFETSVIKIDLAKAAF